MLPFVFIPTTRSTLFKFSTCYPVLFSDAPPPAKKAIKFRSYIPKDETLKEKKFEDTKPESGEYIALFSLICSQEISLEDLSLL